MVSTSFSLIHYQERGTNAVCVSRDEQEIGGMYTLGLYEPSKEWENLSRVTWSKEKSYTQTAHSNAKYRTESHPRVIYVTRCLHASRALAYFLQVEGKRHSLRSHLIQAQ